MNVGYHAVREGWIDDPRTNPNHSAAFRDERGFGGKCFPKDLNALAHVFRELNMKSPLLEGVLHTNEVHTNGD
jgi:UDPglucose 6-dehydrogenase